jgi:hypothetical protein
MLSYLKGGLLLWMTLLVISCGGSSSDSSVSADSDSDDSSSSYTVEVKIFYASDVNAYDSLVDAFDYADELGTNAISDSASATVLIQLTNDDGDAVSGELVTMSTTLGDLGNDEGTALTDDDGIAEITLTADTESEGAGTVTATYEDDDDTEYSDSVSFYSYYETTEDVTIELSVIPTATETDDDGDYQLDAGSSLIIQASIYDTDGELYTSSLTVEFSSGCSDNGTSDLDTSVSSVGGIASSTYTANGCEGEDEVSVSVDAGDETVTGTLTIEVAESNVGSIQFDQADPENIYINGTGNTTTSNVSFYVYDDEGNAKRSEEINFELSSNIGGDNGATVSPSTSYTNTDGYVEVTVTSGSVAETVRVVASATYTDEDTSQDTTVTGTSNALVISTGLPDQDSFSLSADILNPEGLNLDGSEVTVTIRAADSQNNPVPDDTAVYFQAEGGSIESSCTTTDGSCSVTWTSQSPRPSGNTLSDYLTDNGTGACSYFSADTSRAAPCIVDDSSDVLGAMGQSYGGRVTILATADGEESFTDANGDGLYNDGDELLTDMPEAWEDDNEDGYYSGEANAESGDTEEFRDNSSYATTGSWDDADGVFNGLLCDDDADSSVCTDDLIEVRGSLVIVMSGSTPYVRTQVNGSDAIAIDLSVNSTVNVYVADQYNNPMPYGTTIEFDTVNGDITSTTSYTVDSTNNHGPTSYAVVLEGDGDASTGNLTITITPPDSEATEFTVSVTDADD